MLGDTIAAVASPPGASDRGIVRISGPDALAAAGRVLRAPLPRVRGAHARQAVVRATEIPALCVVMPAPRSYTGEDVVELHLPGAPLLLREMLSALEAAGTRSPTPGEFSRRAFANGRLRLEQAEAVADLIAAENDAARRMALYALSGGLMETVARIRQQLDDARATLESGLDFTAEETGAVASDAWLGAIDDAAAMLADAIGELPDAVPAGDLLLLGAANAGKSSLCNALAGRDVMLVGAAAGTTRDVVAVPLPGGPTLLDAPGDVDGPGAVEAAALRLRDRLGARATGVLLVVDLAAPRLPVVSGSAPVVALVGTKLDLVDDPTEALDRLRERGRWPSDRAPPCFSVSNRTGAGVAALRAFLATSACGHGAAAGTVRWRDALRAALAAVRRAGGLGREGGGEELVAADLALASAALDEVHGVSAPESILDRIFARFCLGK